MEQPKENSLENNEAELKKCAEAILLYRACCKAFYDDSYTRLDQEHFDEAVKEMLNNEHFRKWYERESQDYAPALINKRDGGGLRLGSPFSDNDKFRYWGTDQLGLKEGSDINKKFFIATYSDENDPEYPEFQARVAKAFADRNLPFYSIKP